MHEATPGSEREHVDIRRLDPGASSFVQDQHQERGHPTTLRDKNVEGTAGGIGAHHLHAGAEAREANHDFDFRQVMRRTGSDQEYLGVEFRDLGKDPGIDVGKALHAFTGAKAVGREEDGGRKSLVVDDEETPAIGTHEVRVRVRIGSELHVMGLARWRSETIGQ